MSNQGEPMKAEWIEITREGGRTYGALCEYEVNRVHPTLRMRVQEKCLEAGAWYRPGMTLEEHFIVCARHRRQIDNPPKRKRRSPVERYNAQVRAHEAALRDIEITRTARQLFGTSAK